MHSFEEMVVWDLRLPNAGIVAIFGVFHAMCVTLLRQLLSTNAASEPTADKESKTRVDVVASVRITNVVLSTLAMMKDMKRCDDDVRRKSSLKNARLAKPTNQRRTI
jgi:ABC-type cobalamin transport system permease subunit